MDVMAGDNIHSAVLKLSDRLITVRQKGLSELRTLFRSRSSVEKLEQLGTEGWHKVLETLFQLVKNEKPATLRGAQTTIEKAESRLQDAADAFQTVVTFCVGFINHKTAHAILDHVVDTLPMHDGSYCQPLFNKYLDSFQVVLAYPSHGEHLKPKQWLTYLDFVLEIISAGTADKGSLRLEGAFGSLRYMVGITNAPLRLRLQEIATSLVENLHDGSSRPEVPFDILNSIICAARVADVDVIKYAIEHVFDLARLYWHDNSQLLHEQLLTSLLLLQDMLRSPILQPFSESTRRAFLHLKETVVADYTTKNPKAMLQISDLIFARIKKHDFLGREALHINHTSSTGLLSWSELYIISALDLITASQEEHDDASQDERGSARKRQKQSPALTRYIDAALAETDDLKIVPYLQLAWFNVCQDSVEGENLLVIVDQLLSASASHTSIRTPWILLILARLCKPLLAIVGEAGDMFQRLTRCAGRFINDLACSRTACYLLYCILVVSTDTNAVNIKDVQNACFRGSSGPSSFCDASLLLWTACLKFSNINNAKVFQESQLACVLWLSRKLSPSRSMETQIRKPGILRALHELCQAILALPLLNETQPVLSFPSPISQHFLVPKERQQYCKMLFCLQNLTDPADTLLAWESKSESLQEYYQLLAQCLMDQLRALESIGVDSSEPSSQLSEDRTISLAMSVIACLIFDPESYAMAYRECRNIFEASLRSVETWAKATDWQIVPWLCEELLYSNAADTASAARHQLVQIMLQNVNDRPSKEPRHSELDLEFETSTPLRLSQKSSQNRNSRIDDSQQIRVRIRTTRLKLLAMPQSLKDMNHRNSCLSEVVGFIENTTAIELMTVGHILLDFLQTQQSISSSILHQVFQRVAELFLQDTRFERNEAALCFCLDMLRNTASTWLVTEHEGLAGVAFDIYNWFIKVLFGKRIAPAKEVGSDAMLIALSTLLQAVLQHHADYAINRLPSARTILLQILNLGRILDIKEPDIDAASGPKQLEYNNVIFHLSEPILKLFEGYIITEHPAVFDDVVDCLPSDLSRRETVAVQLYILGRMGCRWRTVARQAVYHIFETVANANDNILLATYVCGDICTQIGIKDGMDLFRLFSSQIFYTWLEPGLSARNNSITTIPFAIFGYNSLISLLKDNDKEIIAQVNMRQIMAQIHYLSDVFSNSWSELTSSAFPLCIAYAISEDVVTHRASHEIGPVENNIRSYVKEADLPAQCGRHLATILGLLIIHLADDKGLDKALAHSTQFKTSFISWSSICQKGSSSMEHPTRQDPSYKCKYLPQMLAKLCMLSNTTLEGLWTAPLLTWVYRMLLDDIVIVLGKLHTAAIIRKLRLVVALAGPTALRGYPLEMLLSNLRPHLSQFYSAEDTIGVYWYLLERGKTFLCARPSFLAGLTITIFADLAQFAVSKQDSMTQESQFTTALGKATDFTQWLGPWLLELQLSLDSTQTRRFTSLISNAQSMSTDGNNGKDRPEGKLLYEVLCDRASPHPLLSDTAFSSIVQALSKNFTRCADYSDDILQTKDDILRCAPVLKSLLEHSDLNQTFRTWAGFVVGKAYVHNGSAVEANQLPISVSNTCTASNSVEVVHSYAGILDALYELATNLEARSAGSAERALSRVLSGLSKSNLAAVRPYCAYAAAFEDLIFPTESIPDIDAKHLTGSQCTTMEVKQGLDMDFVGAIAPGCENDVVLSGILDLLTSESGFANSVSRYVCHVLLNSEFDQHEKTAKTRLSRFFNNAMNSESHAGGDSARTALNVILYLRRCVYPAEQTFAQRGQWLDIDYEGAAQAALMCGMSECALLMLETKTSEAALPALRARRPSLALHDQISELAVQIFRKVSDADYFYARLTEDTVEDIVRKLDHEGLGSQVLSFRSAQLESCLRVDNMVRADDDISSAVFKALSQANLGGLAYATSQASTSSTKLENIDWSQKVSTSLSSWNIYGFREEKPSFKSLLSTVELTSDTAGIDLRLKDEFRPHLSVGSAGFRVHLESGKGSDLNELAAASVIEFLMAPQHASLSEKLQALELGQWTQTESLTKSSSILLQAQSALSAMRQNDNAKALFGLTRSEIVQLEIAATRHILRLARTHQSSQLALNQAQYLTQLEVAVAKPLNLDMHAIVQYDMANTLWAQGEINGPIQMLSQLQDGNASNSCAIRLNIATVLTDLGQKLGEARLRRPDEVMVDYLQPAIVALQGMSTGMEAGQVFHNFAAYCDKQLQDPASRDDFERLANLRSRKEQEMNELFRMYKGAAGKERDVYKGHYKKAQTWFALDDEEYQRAKTNRDDLLHKAIENYLLSLHACDNYGKDVLRFLSLWLGNAHIRQANEAVQRQVKTLPTWKVAAFVNQLASRLLDNQELFQDALFELLFKLCCEHPYHTLYQLFAASKSKGQRQDEAAQSRHRAAGKLASLVQNKGGKIAPIWISVHNSNIVYVQFAMDKPEKEAKTNAKMALKSFKSGVKLIQTISDLHKKVPPPTMKIDIRPDKDYSNIPVYSSFDPQVSIAGGISAPKISTIIAEDGSRHKLLLKGGNDDLRQDAIMEQVFASVSELLQDYRPTRVRKMGIRTYKVVPLTHNAGIIEFVQNTIPLHEYLLPAHTRYYPKDEKHINCRKAINDVATKKLFDRVRAYKDVCAKFHPVMRFFHMERFLEPAEWFSTRLAYVRSTAAISILGHVLGLGDRHGHNILLDEKTGEVVHIDLGVAFESGRVLPIPEAVPFRLTRDSIDGMGIAGVEGPFRRCCNFTLEALRQNQDAISTILDVLRWDPLYSWSVSPLRLARMQNNQAKDTRAALNEDEEDISGGEARVREVERRVNAEQGEADRALAVVAKKLSATLSVEATVNELIRQATDENNLAVMYSGWAAYV